jgi:hypothetical protein
MSPHGLSVEEQRSCHGIKAIPARSFPAYKERHNNSAPKIRLATMASHKARDGLSPRALLMWLVIMTPAVNASQISVAEVMLALQRIVDVELLATHKPTRY